MPSTATSSKDSYSAGMYTCYLKDPPNEFPTSRGMLLVCYCHQPLMVYIANTLENQGRRFWKCRNWQVSWLCNAYYDDFVEWRFMVCWIVVHDAELFAVLFVVFTVNLCPMMQNWSFCHSQHTLKAKWAVQVIKTESTWQFPSHCMPGKRHASNHLPRTHVFLIRTKL